MPGGHVTETAVGEPEDLARDGEHAVEDLLEREVRRHLGRVDAEALALDLRVQVSMVPALQLVRAQCLAEVGQLGVRQRV